MDENFLLHRKRALRLLELMREHGKAWALYVFSSANALRQYTDDELVGLGVSWVWLGLEGEQSAYAKLKGTDTLALVRRLQGLGIRVLGSSIVGLAEHGADNIDRAIDHAVAHDTEFHQFMLYTPVPGTPLHAEHRANGTLLSAEECPDADTHGQLRFNYRHPRIRNGEETEYLLRAFRRDFEVNGPSVTRIARTLLRGWLALKDHPDPRVRDRVAFETKDLADAVRGGALGVREVVRARRTRRSRPGCGRPGAAIEREFGWKARLAARLVGPVVLATLWREERRLRRGRTYEPPTFYEANPAAAARPEVATRGAVRLPLGRASGRARRRRAKPSPDLAQDPARPRGGPGTPARGGPRCRRRTRGARSLHTTNGADADGCPRRRRAGSGSPRGRRATSPSPRPPTSPSPSTKSTSRPLFVRQKWTP